MNKRPVSKTTPSIKRMKKRAKTSVQVSGGSLTAALDEQARRIGIDTFARVPQRTSDNGRKPFSRLFNSDRSGDPQIAEMGPQPVYSRVIAGCAWSLELGESSPELWLRKPGGAAPQLACQLGIFPVLVPPGSFCKERPWWVLARYGDQSPLDLPEMTEDSAQKLASHFGISIARPRVSDYRLQSELLFLQSPAFASLRLAIRKGLVKQPKFQQWVYGLSHLWSVLVAMSDAHFDAAGAGTAKYLMSTGKLFQSEWWGSIKKLVDANWEQIPKGNTNHEGAIAELVPHWMASEKPISWSKAHRQLCEALATYQVARHSTMPLAHSPRRVQGPLTE